MQFDITGAPFIAVHREEWGTPARLTVIESHSAETNKNFFDNGTFSFIDDVQTLSSAAGDDLFATISTDANGNITNYAIEASSTTDLNDFISIQSFGGSPADFGKVDTGYNIADAGSNTAGRISATPEPSSLALLGSGVFGLAFQLRRRIRRA